MDKQTLVSVVIPVHNSEETLHTALQSVLQQRHASMEVLIVDDCSNDDSVSVIRGFTDPRIRLFRHSVRRGPGAARNTAIRRASGKWLAFIDADDMWVKGRLDQLLRLASKHADAMVCDSVAVCTPTRRGLKPISSYWTEDDLRLIRSTRVFGLENFLRLSRWTVQPIIPLDAVRKYQVMQPEREYAEDIEFLIRLLQKGVRLVIDEREMYLYRKGAESASSNPQRAIIFRRVLENLIEELELTDSELKELQRRMRELEWQADYISFVESLKEGDLASLLKKAVMKPGLTAELARRLPATLNMKRHQLAAKYRK